MKRTKAIAIDIVEDKDIRRVIFRVFISALIILSVTYMYLIGSITFNVLARKSIESESRQLASKVGDLELKYLNDANKIDKAYAISLGFVDSKANIFTTRNLPSVAIR
jgi:hypothetical protein